MYLVLAHCPLNLASLIEGKRNSSEQFGLKREEGEEEKEKEGEREGERGEGEGEGVVLSADSSELIQNWSGSFDCRLSVLEDILKGL